MLQVAGTLLFAAMSHGPVDKSQAKNQSGENGDTPTQSLSDDLHMAIDFYSDLTMMVCGETYDRRFEPELTAVVMCERRRTRFQSDSRRQKLIHNARLTAASPEFI